MLLRCNSGRRWTWRVGGGHGGTGHVAGQSRLLGGQYVAQNLQSQLYAKKALFCDPQLPVKRRTDAFHSTCVQAAPHGAGEWAYTQ